MPSPVKAFFLCLPWLLVAYGAGVLIDYVEFHNNSVEAEAVVVDYPAGRKPVAPGLVRAVGTARAEAPPVPGFLYTHDSGEAHVGRSLNAATAWSLVPGQRVTVRYDRTRPELAQPVTLMGFWMEPGRFLLGGLCLFAALASAFRLVEGDTPRTATRDTLSEAEPRLKLVV